MGLTIAAGVDLEPLGGDCYSRRRAKGDGASFEEEYHCLPEHRARLTDDQRRILARLPGELGACGVSVEESGRSTLVRRGLGGASTGLLARFPASGASGADVRSFLDRLTAFASELDGG